MQPVHDDELDAWHRKRRLVQRTQKQWLPEAELFRIEERRRPIGQAAGTEGFRHGGFDMAGQEAGSDADRQADVERNRHRRFHLDVPPRQTIDIEIPFEVGLLAGRRADRAVRLHGHEGRVPAAGPTEFGGRLLDVGPSLCDLRVVGLGHGPTLGPKGVGRKQLHPLGRFGLGPTLRRKRVANAVDPATGDHDTGDRLAGQICRCSVPDPVARDEGEIGVGEQSVRAIPESKRGDAVVIGLDDVVGCELSAPEQVVSRVPVAMSVAERDRRVGGADVPSHRRSGRLRDRWLRQVGSGSRKGQRSALKARSVATHGRWCRRADWAGTDPPSRIRKDDISARDGDVLDRFAFQRDREAEGEGQRVRLTPFDLDDVDPGRLVHAGVGARQADGMPSRR